MPTEARQTPREHLAFLGALCLTLATLEYLIPKPIPFLRVGIANLPLLIALRTFRARDVLLLAALKVLGQGLVGGTLFSYVFLFSAAGTLVATLTMLGSHALGGRRISLVGVSLLGALSSNVTQVLLAVALVFGPGGWLIGPPFVVLGTASGAALGLFAEAFERGSAWLEGVRNGLRGLPVPPEPPARAETATARARKARWRGPDRMGRIISRRDVFLAGVVALPAYLFLNRIELVAPLVLLYLLLMLLSGRRFRPLFPLVATTGIVAANLLGPSGRVLLAAGPLVVTAGALETGLRKSLVFVGLVYLSYVAVRPGLRLPGGFGALFARVIYYFERLLEADKVFDRKHPIRSLDAYLWGIFPPFPAGQNPSPTVLTGASRFDTHVVTPRTGTLGWFAAALVALPPWAALLAQSLLG